jgi:DNA invertase Pin-like site-specific DNA recombinase
MLKDLNIKLISLAEMLDFGTPMGKMVLTMLAGFAELENEMRAEQIMAGKLEMAKLLLMTCHGS